LHLWRESKEEDGDYNENGLNSDVHMREVFEMFPQLVEKIRGRRVLPRL